ncbi:MAG: hypothetical protein AAF184_04535 [Pseudomonadota bacterium]
MHPIDSSLARRSNVARKAIAYSLQGARTARRLVARPQDFAHAPPIVANSIPKSGTHLLLQIARALPRTRYYGSFLAWASSLDLRKRPERSIAFHLDRVVPGEAVGAHLHFSEATSAKLESINALHLMIVRDHEAIIRSEAHYLRHMNRFHRMAREFRGLDERAALDRVRDGSPHHPELYPSFEERIRPYKGWRQDPRVVIVRYEDFEDPAAREQTVARIVQAWAGRAKGAGSLDLDACTRHALASIAPERSHTYTGGRDQ